MDDIPPFGRLASGLPLSLPSKETQESQPPDSLTGVTPADP